jgi:3-dehydroquinate synthetase
MSLTPVLATEHRLRFDIARAPERTDVVLGRGLLARAAVLLEAHPAARTLIVSDETVGPLHAAPLVRALRADGRDAHLLTIPASEEGKTLDELDRLYAACHAREIERRDLVMAVGGGVVGDVAGMLAATYLRGLTLVAVPTSLVAMVTAAVGGKVGVNLGGHKNLVGAFKQPSLVIVDFETLATLPELELRSGLGELLGVGMLGVPEVFAALCSGPPADLEPLVAAAIRCKMELVAADAFDEHGLRARLNLGHTFGHALEAASGFRLAHGLAVGVGLLAASRMSAALGLCSPDLPQRVRAALDALGLPAAIAGCDPGRVMAAMRADKKRSSGRLRFVLPTAIGEVRLVGEEEIPRGLLAAVVEGMVEES